ncbi:homeodomain-like protein [Tanacetum coccineum]
MPLSTYLNLGLGELAHTRLTVELADRTVKYPKGIAENVLIGIGKFTFPIVFIILDMPKDVKVPLILGRPFLNQGDDLMPTIEEDEVIKEFKTRDEDLDTGIDDYPSYCDDDKKIHIDCAHNLKFSCMIGFEFTHTIFFPLLYVNMMPSKFHNSIMKNKMVYKGNNVVGALMNVPIFVGTFSVITDFVVLEDMDAYCDNEMGDIIFCKPFLREVGIKTKHFEGIITLYNGDNEVTYQMVRSHPKFKHHTNEQCNKIPPLLKVSEKDKINRISYAYQKLKEFYKEVLNLGPDFIRVPSMKEWLTRGTITA